MSRFNYFHYLQLKAFDNVFNPTDDYLQRKICRWYSKEYNTPLHQVLEMSFDNILTHYYESMFENMNSTQLYDNLIPHLPEIIEEQDTEDEEFTQMLEKEQENQLKKKQSLAKPIVPIIPSSINNPPSQPEDVIMTFDDNPDD